MRSCSSTNLKAFIKRNELCRTFMKIKSLINPENNIGNPEEAYLRKLVSQLRVVEYTEIKSKHGSNGNVKY